MLPCDRLQGGELEAEPAGDLPVLRVERLGRDQEAQGTGGGSHPPPFPSLPSPPCFPPSPTYPPPPRGGDGSGPPPALPPSLPTGQVGPSSRTRSRGKGGGSARCLRDGEGEHRDGGGNRPRRGLPPCHLPRRLFRSGAVPQRRRFLLLLLPEVSRNTGGRGGPGHRARPACGGALWSPAGPRPSPGGCAKHNGWERVPAPGAAARSVRCVFPLKKKAKTLLVLTIHLEKGIPVLVRRGRRNWLSLEYRQGQEGFALGAVGAWEKSL